MKQLSPTAKLLLPDASKAVNDAHDQVVYSTRKALVAKARAKKAIAHLQEAQQMLLAFRANDKVMAINNLLNQALLNIATI